MARFMLFMYPGISDEEYAEGPSLEDVEAMTRYNEELTKAGALLAADGLQPRGVARLRRPASPTARSARPRSWSAATGSSRPRTARRRSSGPSASRSTASSFVEVRQIYELSDFPEDIQAAAELSTAPPQQTSA